MTRKHDKYQHKNIQNDENMTIINTKLFHNDENMIGFYVQKIKIQEKSKIYNIWNI